MNFRNKLFLSAAFMLASVFNPMKSTGQTREIDKKGNTTETPAQGEDAIDLIRGTFVEANISAGVTTGEAGGELETEFAGAEIEGSVSGFDANGNNKLEANEIRHAEFLVSEKIVTIDQAGKDFSVQDLVLGAPKNLGGYEVQEYEPAKTEKTASLKDALKSAKTIVMKQ